jgi:hypothetical protein
LTRTKHLKNIAASDKDVTLKIPGFEGFEMIVKANSVTFPDGSRQGPLVVSPVHIDRLPMVPPGGSATFMAPAWTIQPTGTRFDPPIEVHIPNSRNMKPGEVSEIYQWDHDLATFLPMGRATVSEDGAVLVTDAGYGVTKAGWGGNPPPPPPPPNCAVAQQCKDCNSWRGTVAGVNICKCLPESDFNGNNCGNVSGKDAPCRKCQEGKCQSSSAECDDGKYCTGKDKCGFRIAGQCKGDDIPDKRLNGTKWSTGFGEWMRIFPGGDFFGRIKDALGPIQVTIEGENEHVLKCCETLKGEMIPEVKTNGSGKVAVELSLPAIAFPPIVNAPGYIGLVVRGTAAAGVSVQYTSNQCKDNERCNQNVEGKLEFEAQPFVGVAAGSPKTGNSTIIDAALFGKIGVDIKYTEKASDGGGILTGENKGAIVGYRFVFASGLIQIEKEFQLAQPFTLFTEFFPSYPISSVIPGFKPCSQ